MPQSIMRVSKVKTNADNWNDIVSMLYKDEYMHDLMCVPDETDILTFIDKYFVRGVGADELVTTEDVRIIWSDGEGTDTWNGAVKFKTKNLDIFVKDDVLHTATVDRMQYRFQLIEERLKDILLVHRSICGMRFSFIDSYDMYTKSIGYSRYRVIFGYKVTK